MQSSVFPFVVINMDGDFLHQAQRLAVGGFVALEVGPENIVGLAGRNSLCELAMVVGIDFPLGFLALGGTDFHGDAIDRMVVRAPDRAEDDGVGFFRRGMMLGGTWARIENHENDQKEREGIKPCGMGAQAESRSSHRLRFPPPLLRLLPHSRLPRLSIQADWL